jgi:hypothetical protein
MIAAVVDGRRGAESTANYDGWSGKSSKGTGTGRGVEERAAQMTADAQSSQLSQSDVARSPLAGRV